jgi:hypothetical protein
MAAWKHWQYWNPGTYQAYRKYVIDRAPLFRGRVDLDCADITLVLLIEFAADRGLPVTFWDNDQVRYPSKGTRQRRPRSDLYPRAPGRTRASTSRRSRVGSARRA